MSFPTQTQTTSIFASADLRNTAVRVLLVVHEWRARRALKQVLGDATDRQLRDAGLIRQDVEEACDLPLSLSANSAVRAAAKNRAGNW